MPKVTTEQSHPNIMKYPDQNIVKNIVKRIEMLILWAVGRGEDDWGILIGYGPQAGRKKRKIMKIKKN